jgi:mannose-1-phosphate guanylyltransferase
VPRAQGAQRPGDLTAVVLVGGEGLRLRPLTEAVPKGMVPLVDRPQLAYVLDYLRTSGVTDVVLACGYQADAIRSHFGDSFKGLRLDYTVESTPLGTAGAIGLAGRSVDHTLLALNGDSLRSASITALLDFHRSRSAVATLLLAQVADVGSFGLVQTDESGRVVSFLEKPVSSRPEAGLINAGLYVLEPEAFDLIPPDGPVSLERDVFPRLAERGVLHAVELPGLLIDMGTPSGYLEAQAELLTRGPSLDIDADARVAADVALVPPVRVAKGAAIGEGATVGPFVSLGRDATVAAGAEIRRSAVLPGATVPVGARITDAIVAPNVVLDGCGRRRLAGTELS